MTPPITLEYAKGVPRWRRWVWRGVLAGLALGLALAGWYWRADISRHVTAWQAQRKCLAYSLPATEVIVEPDPTRARALLARPADYVPILMNGGGAMRRTDAWKDLAPFCLKSAGYWTSSAIFMHERVARGPGGGQKRLVIVLFYDFYVSATREGPCMRTQALREASLWKFPEGVSDVMYGIGFDTTDTPDPQFRVFAGQADPADAAHFTIDYEEWGQRDTVDGWLESNDSVKLKPRRLLNPPRAGTP